MEHLHGDVDALRAELVALRAELDRLRRPVSLDDRLNDLARLAGGIAHDINNLLTAIVGYAEIAVERCEPEEPIVGDLSQVLSAADKAARMTDLMLAFARRRAVAPRPFDLNAVITDVAGQMAAADPGVRPLVLELTPEGGAVRGETSRMTMLLTHLVIAVRSGVETAGSGVESSEGVTIRTFRSTVRRTDRAVTGGYLLEVEGSARHIRGVDPDRVFDPYAVRLPGGESPFLLASCYGIVRQMDGEIEFVATTPTCGMFRVWLPAVGGPTESVTGDTPADAPTGSETVLLVDDEPLVRDVATRQLRAQGYTVLTAASGEEAIRIAGAWEETIHLLVTDIMMPNLGGYDTARAILQSRPETLVLYMSGFTDEPEVQSVIESRQVAYLAKPFSHAQIATRVRAVLDAREPT